MEQHKLLYSVVGTSLFAAVSLPYLYNYTNPLFGESGSKCPTPLTRLLHCGVYAILQYLLLKVFNMRQQPVNGEEPKFHDDRELLLWSIKGMLLYHFVSDSNLYILSQSLFSQLGGINIADDGGCPNLLGIAVHAVVFFLSLWALLSVGNNLRIEEGDQ